MDAMSIQITFWPSILNLPNRGYAKKKPSKAIPIHSTPSFGSTIIPAKAAPEGVRDAVAAGDEVELGGADA